MNNENLNFKLIVSFLKEIFVKHEKNRISCIPAVANNIKYSGRVC